MVEVVPRAVHGSSAADGTESLAHALSTPSRVAGAHGGAPDNVELLRVMVDEGEHSPLTQLLSVLTLRS